MDWLRFWALCFSRACRLTIEATDAIMLVVPALAGGIAYMLGYEIDWTAPTWVAGLAVLGAIFLVRLFLVAPFQVWREEHRKRIALQNLADKKDAVERLSLFLADGAKLKQRQITLDQYKQWKHELVQWIETVSYHIKNEFGEADRQLFLSPATPMAAQITGTASAEHNDHLLWLEQRLSVLRSIIERYGAR